MQAPAVVLASKKHGCTFGAVESVSISSATRDSELGLPLKIFVLLSSSSAFHTACPTVLVPDICRRQFAEQMVRGLPARRSHEAEAHARDSGTSALQK